MNGLFRLSGRVAVVTGAQGRLGAIWIGALLDAGASVVGVDRPGVAPSGPFAGLQEQYGSGRVVSYEADIRDRAQLDALLGRCLTEIGTPDVLVNNAGIDQPPDPGAPRFSVGEIPAEHFRGTLDVNVFGTFQMIQVFGPPMVAAGRGSIINIGSLYASVAPDPYFYEHLGSDPPFLKPPAYGASKAGVLNLTGYFATLWGPSGVRVNALSPGGVLGDQDEHFRRKFCARVPLGRMAEASDLVGPLLFLASDASAYVTGIDLRVDGGFTAW